MVSPSFSAVLASAGTAFVLWTSPSQAFIFGGSILNTVCYGGVIRDIPRSTTTTTATTSPTKLPLNMETTHDSTAIDTTNKPSVSGRPPTETTYVRGRKVMHIAADRDRSDDGDTRMCDLISSEAGISLDRAIELVKFGAVYIGEDARQPVSSDVPRELRRGRGGGEYQRVGRNPLTEDQKRKMAAKRASGQLPFEWTSFDHIRLRRLGRLEGMDPPPAGSYLRVHCDPMEFAVAEEIDWSDQIIGLTDDYVVVNKPAGMPTVATIDNVVQSVLYQAGLAVARAGGIGGEKDEEDLDLPLMHAVSRLDVCTSGVVVFARNKLAAGKLNDLFSSRDIIKHYLALLAPGPGLRAGPVAHCCRGKSFDGMRRAKIYAEYDPDLLEGEKWGGHWQEARSTILTCVPATGPGAAAAVAADVARDIEISGLPPAAVGSGPDNKCAHLCLMKLETGRTHQLRMQLAAMGAGIVGDTQYRGVVGRIHEGGPEDDRTDMFGQEPTAIALTAARLEFEWNSERVIYTVRPPAWAVLHAESVEDSGVRANFEGSDSTAATEDAAR